MAKSNPSRRPKLLSFQAAGILGGKTYTLDLKSKASLIVGPNGSGKSTFLSLFYLFLSRQWSRLAEYDFEQLTLTLQSGAKEQKISVARSDVMAVELPFRSSPRLRQWVARLSSVQQLELLFTPTMSESDKDKVARTLSISGDEVGRLRLHLQQEMGITTKKALEADAALRALGLGRVLYMPTYRRIEKDLQAIFPDIEDRLRTRIDEYQVSARSNTHFQEIVSFGMEDIASIIQSFSNSVRELQRRSTEKASQEYILDIVRGRISDSSLDGIRALPQDALQDFIGRLDSSLFTNEDQESLRQKIQSIRDSKSKRRNTAQQYLGLFVERLFEAYNLVKEKEQPLLDFGKYVSSYLGSNKQTKYDDLAFKIEDAITKKEIRLNELSSGEKQIISIFAYLLLRTETNYVLFIDEPELSLSVPWQRKFLPDLLATKRCEYLFSVTHSPFVFDNDLRNSVVDVERLVD